MIRDFRPEDAEHLAALCRASIRVLGARVYSPAQVQVWYDRAPSAQLYLDRVNSGARIFLAEVSGGRVAAYALVEPDGHVDRLFCHPEHAGHGHASALLTHLDQHARATGIVKLYTDASEIARLVFERAGYRLDHRRDFEMNGVAIHNYAMSKIVDVQLS